ncbi:AmmeMemoRadiSam system radical SAM enzyme [Candidatus Woesearchaeota archaeon]|nr:MAG: AmmeMemoRadiSam system radical SAM enzyme [Candidatus Woesearchaeota archaeon]
MERLKEALYYEKKQGSQNVQCRICPRNCIIAEGKTGFCRVRRNIGGKLYAENYSRPCSIAIDPVEKKPLYHFLPGQDILSIATVGCNLACKHCQNYEISQAEVGAYNEPKVTPEEIVDAALRKNCSMIAYTYTEPTIFYEYVLDTAKLAKQKGIRNVIVSNGYINPEPLKELLKYIDAANIDLKAFDGDFYKKITLAKLEPVLETLRTIAKSSAWLEITNLIIPTLNDSISKIREMAAWISAELGADVPLHLTRFHPYYKLSHLPPTPEETLTKAYMVAKEKLNYVYVGNILTEEGQHTYCPECGELLIERVAFRVVKNRIKNSRCPSCKAKIAGVWS